MMEEHLRVTASVYAGVRDCGDSAARVHCFVRIISVSQAVQQAPRPADHYQRAAVGSCHGFAGVLMIRTNTCTTSIATFVQFIG